MTAVVGVGGLQCTPLKRLALGARDGSCSTYTGSVSLSLVGEKWPEGNVTAPHGLCHKSRGTEGSTPVLRDERCDPSEFNGYGVQLDYSETLESPMGRRTVFLLHWSRRNTALVG